MGGQMYDSAAKTCRTVFWERWWNNDWGSENGYVPNRRITFTKWRDDTDVKITYHDNMRVHGTNWCRAAWYVEIDRSECKDPGRISFDKYSHQQHNYWMNDHVGGSAHGVCRSTGKGRITKGGTTAREVTSLWRRSPPPRGPAEVGPRHAEGEDLVAPASCCCLLLVISGRRLCNCVCVCVYVFLVCVVPM